MPPSSLNYLEPLPINVLTTERSFVMDMATSPGDAMIVRSTIDLGRAPARTPAA